MVVRHPKSGLRWLGSVWQACPILISNIGAYLALQILLFNGACIHEFTFHDDEYFLHRAIETEINLTRRDKGNIACDSIEHFLDENPDCCRVSRWIDQFGERRIYGKLFLIYNTYVDMKYRANRNKKGFNTISFISYSNCDTMLDISRLPNTS